MEIIGLEPALEGDPGAIRGEARRLRATAGLIGEVATALDRRVDLTPYAGPRADAFRAAMKRRRQEALRVAEDVRHAAWLLDRVAERVEADQHRAPLCGLGYDA